MSQTLGKGATAQMPQAWVRVQSLAEAGDFAGALAVQRQMIPLMDAIFAEENPGPAREALRQLGMETGNSRLPIAQVLTDLRADGHPLLQPA